MTPADDALGRVERRRRNGDGHEIVASRHSDVASGHSCLAYEEICWSYAAQVGKLAKILARGDPDLTSDLIQHGYIALWRAFRNAEASVGEGYFVRAVRLAMYEAIRKERQERIVVPVEIRRPSCAHHRRSKRPKSVAYRRFQRSVGPREPADVADAA